ncbi:MAG: GYF domain-containing protein [Sodaliphilus sp.]
MKMYFYMDANMQRRGPYALQVLVTFIAPHTLVWTEGMAQWAPAGTIPEIAKVLGISTNGSRPPFEHHESLRMNVAAGAPSSLPASPSKRGIHPAMWALVAILVVAIAVLIGVLVAKNVKSEHSGAIVNQSNTHQKDTVVVTQTVPVMVPVTDASENTASPVLICATISDPDGYTNVRKGPSISYPVVGAVYEGEVIYYEVVKGSNWYRVYDDDQCFWGYIHKSRLRKL